EDAYIPFEEEILRHPYSVKCWIKYIEHKQIKSDHAHSSAVNLIYERALRVLPG
uniref:Pre-mRNA-splicing factor Syf1-like N-terminal HAT-repeats domain-containing protein n=1 Tax=Amphimedon queenslandica TaxID=400682 RepID=A0A1X7TFD6_AMPQE